MINFLGQEIQVGKLYVYLKNHRTGSSTTRKLKMIGKCTHVGKKIKFQVKYCECPTYFEITEEDILLSPEDVICEYIPTEEQWVKELDEPLIYRCGSK